MILNLGLGERCLLHRRPHDRFLAAIEKVRHCDAEELGDDLRLALKAHGEIRPGIRLAFGLIPFGVHAKTAELLALYIDPVGGIITAGLAELRARHLFLGLAVGTELLFDLPFDRKSVAVPARDKASVIAHHLVRAADHILQDLVHRGAEVDVTIRIGRAVMIDEFRAVFALFAEAFIELHLLPFLDPLRLGLWQARTHREVGFRQEERVAIIARAGVICCVGIGHGRSSFRSAFVAKNRAGTGIPTASLEGQLTAGPLIRKMIMLAALIMAPALAGLAGVGKGVWGVVHDA